MSDNIELESVNCNICGSNDTKNLFDRQGNIVKCKKCGLVYKNPRIPKQKWFDNLSETKYENAGERFFTSEKEMYSLLIKDLKKRYDKERIRLIDIGCGYGPFLKLAEETGWDVCGTEVSKGAVDYVKNKLNIEVYQKDMTEMQFPDESFDIVAMLGVLDLLHDPKKHLEEIKRITKKNGILVMRINNGLWHITLTRVSKILSIFRIYPAVLHLFAFTPGTVKKILKKSGFEEIEICNSKPTKGDIYKTGGFLGKYFVIAVKSIVYYSSQLIYYLSLKKLVFSSAMLVFARKR